MIANPPTNRPNPAKPGLARKLGLFDATMLVMGGIVGSGIFINPYVVAQQVHTPALILGAWIFGGIIGIGGAFIWAELAATLPEVGGQYAYLREAYHPAVAFLYGWVLLLVIQAGGMAAVSITFARYFRRTHRHARAGLGRGDSRARHSYPHQLPRRKNWRTNAKRAHGDEDHSPSRLVIVGLVLTGKHVTTTTAAQREWSVSSFGAAMVPVLFAYGGWQTANFLAAEVKEPRRTCRRGLLLGVAGVVTLYLGVNWVCLRALGRRRGRHEHARHRRDALALGQRGATFIAAAIAISTLGFLSQSILTAPRVYFAMADDGLFFRQVAWLDPRTHVPVVAIILQSVWTMVIALSGRYEQILNYVISMDFLFFGLTATTIFVFRRRASRGAMNPSEGYRMPGHPVSTALFVAICWWVVANTIYRYPQNSLIGFGILLAGIPVYWLWSRRTSSRSPNV